MITHPLAAALAVALTPAGSAPGDWPEFKGPSRTSTVEAVDSSFEWGEDGPEVLWRVATGPGYGGVAVVGDEVFMLDREIGERDVLRVRSLADGAELWSAGYEAAGRLNFPGSRTVPAVRGGLVVATGGFGHVTAFDREQRAIAWGLDLREEYGGEMPMFGYAAAPLVIGDMVVVPALGEEVGLVALDLESGRKVWATEPVGTSHSTPTLLELNGRRQLLFLSTTYPASGTDKAAETTITSFDPATGGVLWQVETLLTRIPIPGPVKVDDEHIFVTGGYRGGSTLIRIENEGDDEFYIDELFHIDRGAQTHAPLLYENHLYVLVNENWNYSRRRKEGGLLCLTLEGDEVWRTGDDPFFGRGNAILAGDKLLIQDGDNGVLRVVEATHEGYRQVAEANVFGTKDDRDRQMWAPMALADGLLLMRSQDELLCVKL